MNGDGRAYPSVTTLAANTGVGRRTAQRALRELEEKGLLVPGDRRGGRGRAGVYHAALPGKGVMRDTVSGGKRASQTTAKGVTGDTPTTKNTGPGAKRRRPPDEPCGRCGEVRRLADDAAL